MDLSFRVSDVRFQVSALTPGVEGKTLIRTEGRGLRTELKRIQTITLSPEPSTLISL
jgi:hypothetical protein